MGLEPPDDEVLTEESFWTMNRPLPLGCLSHLSHLSHGPNRKSGILQNLAAELSRVALGILSMTDLRTRDPSDEVLETVSLKKAVSVVASRWYDIWADLLQIHWEGYRDVVAAQAGGKVVATGLQGTSVFHALPRPCDDELFLNAEEALSSLLFCARELLVLGFVHDILCSPSGGPLFRVKWTRQSCQQHRRRPSSVTSSELACQRWSCTSVAFRPVVLAVIV